MMNQHSADTVTEYLSVPGGNIAFEEHGTGPLVLLIPGMGDLRSIYRFLAPALAAWRNDEKLLSVSLAAQAVLGPRYFSAPLARFKTVRLDESLEF